MSGEPIFIVGTPRSGTTLLAAQLAAHSKMSCGPETHFFRWLAQTDPRQLCLADQWPRAAIQFIGSIRYKQFGDQSKSKEQLIKKYGVEMPEIETFLRNSAPGIAPLLASVTEPYMRAVGKVRWIEKTPDHIEHVHLIRESFPASPILRIVRDPRDVALSLMRVPWGAKTFAEGLLHARKLDESAAPFFAGDELSYTLRFEDLLSDPRLELRKICRFIGEEFEDEMLNTTTTGQRVNSRNAPWKEKASQPIDRKRIAVWRTELSAHENRLAEAVIGSLLRRHGYPQTEEFSKFGELFPSQQMLLKYANEVQALITQGVRFWQLSEDEMPTVKIYIGNPSHISWLGEKKGSRIARSFSVMAGIIRARRARHDVYWIPACDLNAWSGLFAQMIMLLLKPHKLSVQPNLDLDT